MSTGANFTHILRGANVLALKAQTSSTSSRVTRDQFSSSCCTWYEPNVKGIGCISVSVALSSESYLIWDQFTPPSLSFTWTPFQEKFPYFVHVCRYKFKWTRCLNPPTLRYSKSSGINRGHSLAPSPQAGTQSLEILMNTGQSRWISSVIRKAACRPRWQAETQAFQLANQHKPKQPNAN